VNIHIITFERQAVVHSNKIERLHQVNILTDP